jgi:hypothetical protein
MGSLISKILGDFALYFLERLDRKFDPKGGFRASLDVLLASIISVALVLFCVVTVLDQYGTLLALVPLAIVGVLLAGAFVFVRWRVTAVTSVEAPPVLEAEAAAQPGEAPLTLSKSPKVADVIDTSPGPEISVVRSTAPRLMPSRAPETSLRLWLLGGLASVVGYGVGFWLFSDAVLAEFKADATAQALEMLNTVGSSVFQVCCPGPLIPLLGFLLMALAGPKIIGAPLRQAHPLRIAAALGLAFLLGGAVYVPLQITVIFLAAFSG